MWILFPISLVGMLVLTGANLSTWLAVLACVAGGIWLFGAWVFCEASKDDLLLKTAAERWVAGMAVGLCWPFFALCRLLEFLVSPWRRGSDR
jgi:hypothetical protein